MYLLLKAPAGSGASDSIVREEDGAIIPPDPNNADRIAFAAWEAAGNTPAAAAMPATPIPASITNFQARAQMIADGYFDAVSKVVEASGNATAIAAWDYANVFLRESPFIAMLKGATPYSTDALVDELFSQASNIL